MNQVRKSDMPSNKITFLSLLVHLFQKRATTDIQSSAGQEQGNRTTGKLTVDRLQAVHLHAVVTE